MAPLPPVGPLGQAHAAREPQCAAGREGGAGSSSPINNRYFHAHLPVPAPHWSVLAAPVWASPEQWTNIACALPAAELPVPAAPNPAQHGRAEPLAGCFIAHRLVHRCLPRYLEGTPQHKSPLQSEVSVSVGVATVQDEDLGSISLPSTKNPLQKRCHI